ncbi:unnamed protein product [Dracunculus medinensis]|uniref:Phosphoenolpyruvate carboxykinase n=1 Tax=Dracunculus medinensis TaxID=318479 RepID=A0A0N4U6X1_DRAME|nr:unnamed protein product [Dracunculus medinensis]
MVPKDTPFDENTVFLPRQMSESLKTVESPNFDNLDSEQRKFSLTNLFVRNTSVEEALRRDSKILINGDGFEKSDYMKVA